jgi:hypothetical protein
MRLSPATRFGTYEILAPLGAGGMGEVYRARDTRLKRDVAIKVLQGAWVDTGEGPTLADRLVDGPLALSDAIAISRQIIDALDAASRTACLVPQAPLDTSCRPRVARLVRSASACCRDGSRTIDEFWFSTVQDCHRASA